MPQPRSQSLIHLFPSVFQNTKNKTAVKLTAVSCAPVVEVKIKRPDTKYQLGFSVQNGVVSLNIEPTTFRVPPGFFELWVDLETCWTKMRLSNHTVLCSSSMQKLGDDNESKEGTQRE